MNEALLEDANFLNWLFIVYLKEISEMVVSLGFHGICWGVIVYQLLCDLLCSGAAETPRVKGSTYGCGAV